MATAKKSSKNTKRSKKSAAKKPVVKQSAVVTSAKTLGPLDSIRSFLRGSALIYVALAAAVIAFVLPVTTNLTLHHQARDFLASTDRVVLSSANEVLATIQLKYVLAGMLVLSAIGSALLATKLFGRYQSTVGNKTSGFRWVYIGVTAGVTLEFVALLAGITDVPTLKMICGLIFATAMFGWLSERENTGSRNPRWLAYVISLYAGVLAWLPIFGSLIGTHVYGEERFAWYVYASAGVVLAGFIGFAVAGYRQIRDRNDYVRREESYWRIDFITKVLLVLVIVTALYDKL